MTRKSVLVRGEVKNPTNVVYNYEKTSSDDESVAHLGCMRGTADSQLKIYNGGVPAGVFDYQSQRPGESSGEYNRSYAHEAKPVDALLGGDFVFEGVLDDGQSITRGQAVQFESGTGKIQIQNQNPRCGWADETKSASGADSTINVISDPEHTVITTETITVTAHSGNLTYQPIEIQVVEATTGSGLGGKHVVLVDTTPAAGDVYWALAKALKFNTTDAVTAARVRYRRSG